MNDPKVSATALVADLTTSIGAALQAGAERMASQARADAPTLRSGAARRVPGALKSAIGVVRKPVRPGLVSIAVEIDAQKAFYGRFQEEGFHVGRASPTPVRLITGLRFLRRAFDANVVSTQADAVTAAKAAIERANK